MRLPVRTMSSQIFSFKPPALVSAGWPLSGAGAAASGTGNNRAAAATILKICFTVGPPSIDLSVNGTAAGCRRRCDLAAVLAAAALRLDPFDFSAIGTLLVGPLATCHANPLDADPGPLLWNFLAHDLVDIVRLRARLLLLWLLLLCTLGNR